MMKFGVGIHEARDLGKNEHITIEGPAEFAGASVALLRGRSRRVLGVEFVEYQSLPGIAFTGRLVDSWFVVPAAVLADKMIVVDELDRISCSFNRCFLE
jgi:hypothetical protein